MAAKARALSVVYSLRLALLLAALSVVLPASAAQRKQPSADDPVSHPGIKSVTDQDGNPLPLRGRVAKGPVEPVKPELQRGQAWWPYGSRIAPYNFTGKRVEAMTKDEIQVNGVASINVRDEDATLRLLPAELRLAPGAQAGGKDDGYYLVKIVGFSRTREQIDALRSAGAVLGEYMNVNTYLAKIPAASLARVRALPFVTYVGDYHPAYKISPRIGLESIPADEIADPATGRAKPWLFEITLHKGADLGAALQHLSAIGVVPDRSDVVSSDELTTIFVATAPETVVALAQIPEVKWIAEKTYASLLASSSNPATIPMVLQNNGAYTTVTANGWKLWNAGIDGTGQIVTMMDTGLDTNVEHMADTSTSVGTIGASHRKVVGYDVYGGDQCVLGVTDSDLGHGTWTTQHAVGSISNMTSSPDTTHTPTVNYDNGVARGAKVYFQDIGTASGTINPPLDLGPSIAAAIAKGSFIQNDSWGSTSPSYDTEAANLDTALFNNPSFVVTVSAGNRGAAGTGTIGSPATAKNAIAVGGNDVSSPDSLYINCSWDGSAPCAATDLGSSRGPVSGSLRTKPDIMAYAFSSVLVGGEQEAIDEPAAMCQTDATKSVHWSYVNAHGFGGTSFSAPEVAGLAADVREYFMQGFYPSGAPTPANAFTPSGALIKAVVLASGEPMSTSSSPTVQSIGDRYCSDVGYGRVNVPSVLHVGSSAPFLWVQSNASLGQAATNVSTYTINGNDLPLRVMLVWYDAAGDAIQEDADLRVTIGSSVYYGNALSSGWSVIGGSADHTNTSEGVFLDAAHGLPATGTVQVEVIGFNDPGGMPYSLVVSGNVASDAVKQVSLNKSQYSCLGPIAVTVNDTTVSSPVSVVLVSRNGANQVIDTKTVVCTGSSGTFGGTIQAGTGISVVHGGTLTASYADAAPATAAVSCQAALGDGGSSIAGGCDNASAGTDIATGPLTNGGANEFYTKYMDANEYSSYKFLFVNNTGSDLTDATVALGFSGSGAAKMTRYNGPIHIGPVAAGAVAGAVFQLYTSASTAGMTPVNLDFDVTSPADGYTVATRITQAQTLHANDQIARQNRCSTFNTSLSPWVESALPGRATNPWRWSGTATTPSVVGSENRTDGTCTSSVPNAAAMTGNSGIGSGSNFTGGADSFLLQNFQPALTGNGPNGQPYHYNWAWHSFYHASETPGATTGVWGVFYNDHWNSPSAPSGSQAAAFTNNLSYYYQTFIFDYVSTWNWETANTGTPDNPSFGSGTGGAPNQIIVTFNNVTGLATPTTYFAYGHEHADVTVFGGTSTATTRRDIAFDDDNLVYDEYYTAAQAAACGSGVQAGQVAFDQAAYATCPGGPMVLSVLDANGTSGLTVTVTSPGTGDSEVVALNGTAPYFSATLPYSTTSGVGANNGTLFVLPSDTITATYTDASPAGSSTASATIGCAAADVVYVSNTQVSDNGDNDGVPDNNECVTLDLTIRNDGPTDLTNVRVQLVSKSPTIDLIPDDHADYGTVAAGATASSSAADRFAFHVASSVQCTDPANPPTATFQVLITADGWNGASMSQTFTLNLDTDTGSGTTSYTQSFATNPNWATGVTAPDNPGCTSQTYTNDFHWCSVCGNGGGGYGAWIGNGVFGTPGQQYTASYGSSTLYSPIFTAGGSSVSLQFRQVARTEPASGATLFDGAIVQYQLGAGTWTNLLFSTPAEQATTSGNYCSPIFAGTPAWGGTAASGSVWTLTSPAPVATSAGQKIQFRWRLGADQSGLPSLFGGFGVDDVTVTGLRDTTCEPTRNTGLGPCCAAPTGLPNNTAIDPSICVASGVRIDWAKDPDTWGDGGVGTRTYDVLRHSTAIATGIPYGTTTFTDTTAVPGTTYPYRIRYVNGCGTTSNTWGVSAADGVAINCSDGNPCTDDVCDPATGACTNPNNTAPCNDGNACTTGDVCSGGVCLTGTGTLNCDDGNVCTNDSCNPATGCVHANNTNPCNDGSACTSGDACSGGVCTGTPTVCNDNNPCTTDTCNPATGACVFTNNTAPCNDGNPCTTGDTCSGGACQPGSPTVCNDNNVCTTDTCNPSTGCVFTNNTAACNDGNACTTGDTCSGGTCQPGAGTLACNDNNPCTTDTCNPASGCVFTNNTASCNDGNACTTNDTCSGGVCVGGAAPNCNDNNPCTDDSCNTSTGCVHTNNTASCSDGNACTTGDTCSGGTCQPGAGTLTCNDNNVCTTDTCNPATGCVFTNNTVACNDGNACTTGDTCSGGSCQPGSAVVCNDNNVCTTDTCNTSTGCVFTNNTAACNDGNACTTNDTCSGGVCVGGAAPNCNDNNPCTDDSCNTSTGCVHTNNTASCSDGNACTTGDFCSGGTCQPGTGTLTCNDNNICTTDTCSPATGCVFTNNTVACDDGNACTVNDTCGGGSCQPGSARVCNDNNVCTTDTCNPSTGCVFTNNTLSCDDGNACTVGDVCSGGSCQPGSARVCNDSNACTTDTCNPATGCVFTTISCDDNNPCTTDTCSTSSGCQHSNNNSASCDDGNACTVNDKCAGGTCHAGTTLVCDDGNVCTTDTCNPATGCVFTNNTAACNDGNACTTGDTCSGGTCQPGSPTVCNDNNPCTTDTCNTSTGCVFTNNTLPCNDNNACTTGDTCGGGTCQPGTATVCNDNNVCTTDTCNTATGACVFTNNTASCSDGNACTTNDTCSGGVCVGGAAPNCNDNNPCTDDSCNTSTGCVHTNNTASCNDGNACTTSDTCSGGACVGGPALVCNDNNPCTTDTCNTSTGCVFTNNTIACNDGNACTTNDTCSGGVCVGGAAPNCNDNNPCTDDSCNTSTGCVHTNNTATCSDGNACTTGDFCSGGTCQPGTGTLTCNDNNICTTDTCSPATGCVFTNNTVACDDGNACTVNDTCGGGSCQPGSARVCNDNNVCTTDTCNTSTGCVFTNNTIACNDGNACTTNDTCSGGVCVGGAAPNCNDNNPCTDDSCNTSTGCVHTNNTAACSDGNACTTGDTCSGGSCQPGSATVCNDNNPCTTDTCNTSTGCVFTNNTLACNDGNACTTNDTCSGGTCVGGPAPNCNDNNPCTDDSCNTSTGCVHTNNTATCSDGNACTVGDVCSGGACQAGTGTLTCNDNNICTTDTCSPATGCVFTNNTVACDDGNACTVNDTCGGGSCQPGSARVCNDNNVCTTDTCNTSTGCVFTNNTLACSDGNACTTNDTCSGGVCVGGPAPNCNDSNPCTDDSCNTSTGCVHTNNTASCNDGNACTTNDTCSGGACAGGPALNCNDSNPCTDDSCNTSTGCVHTNNTASCSDGNACTTGDVCSGGSCQPGSPTVCNDNNPCTTDTCNTSTGCVFTNNTLPCNDNNACTTGDTCGGGSCQPGAPTVCNDNNICTTDTCNPSTGCVFTNNTLACNDGNACTTGDTCSGGACQPGAPTVCNDNNPCTTDSCNPSTGCVFANNTLACSDGNVCTNGDVCSGGSCQPGPALVCNDNNPCTTDTCDPVAGCVFTNNTAPCDDGDLCTVGDTCSGGSCQPGGPRNCDDGNPCTDDVCDPATGCVHTNNANACDDGNACTTGDTCQDGTCAPGAPVACDDGDLCTTDSCDPSTGCVFTAVSCDDGNPCTDDSCDSSSGCIHRNNTAPCDDGNACTAGDTCNGGTCLAGVPVVCNDGNVCTTDSCNPATGCVFANNTLSCDDGNACTVGDVCSGGTCTGSPITVPAETKNFAAAGKTTYNWTAATFATQYDVVRGTLVGLPVGPGGSDEVCFNDLTGPTVTDSITPAPGAGFWYLSRGQNTCGAGTYGNRSNGTPRVTTTCP